MTFACSRIGACVSSPHACTSTGRPLAAAKQRRARHRTPCRVHMPDQGVLLESTLRDSRGGLISSGRWKKERSSKGWSVRAPVCTLQAECYATTRPAIGAAPACESFKE